MTKKQEEAFERLQNWQEIERLRGVGAAAAEYLVKGPQTAHALLYDPYLFTLLLADIGKAGLVGEKRNALAIYLAATSRFLETPLNAIIKGGSSGGKNFLAKTVLKFFPADAVVAGSSMSAHAIDYAGPNRLAHKIVYIDEQAGLTHPLRQLMSEGRLVRLTSAMVNGVRVMQEHVTQGPVAGITTTTKNALAIDDENRNFSVFIDESYEQTKAIARAQAVTQREPLSQVRLGLWHEVQRLIAKQRSVPIHTPPWFVDIVDKILPYGDLRIRRYWPSFILSCKTVARIRAAAWSKQDDEITVSFDDFATANCIFDKVVGDSLTRSGGDAEMAIGDLVERLSERNHNGVRASDLIGEPGIRSLDQAYRALRRAKDAGAIFIINDRDRNNEKRYARSPEARFIGTPEFIVTKLGLKISGKYVHPGTGDRIAYGKD
ncbi:MAG TPA: hypothetical protein VKV04_09790 [Verrucomicrobiae bacterium]|nr:hypothetical protein [Verrucomicrobiae bacterium]